MPIFSGASEGSPHGRKLYHLYTDDAAGYWRATRGQDDGKLLTLVKEAHMPFLIDAPQASRALDDDFKWDALYFAQLNTHDGPGTALSPDDGKLYTPGLVTSLFVMQRVGNADTPGTDQGWIYGTTGQDGSQVWSAGLIGSCMECHQRAPHGRLFGLSYIKRAG